MMNLSNELIRDPVAACNALTTEWVRRQCTGKSTVLAGAGVWPLLAILAASADGKARTELERAIGIPAADGFRAARTLLDVMVASTATRAAVGAWFDARVGIYPQWGQAVPAGTFGGLLKDGSDQARLDAWASQQTEGLIPRMPINIKPDTLLVLASALLVRTKWLQPFDEGSVRWGVDYVDGLHRIDRQLDALRIVDGTAGSVTLIEVQGDQDVSVYLALGDRAAPPAGVLAEAIRAVGRPDRGRVGSSLHEGDLAPGVKVELVPSLGPEPFLSLRTVPFRVEAEHDLLAHAALFGLKAASDKSRGHFPKISPVPLALGEARQAVMADFSREGFESAAVTSFGVLAGAAMPLHRSLCVGVTFDRPFGFFAVYRPSRLVLVAGWVAQL